MRSHRYARGFLEICCDADSGLGALGSEYGFTTKRITKMERFDTTEGVGIAMDFVDKCKRCDVWGSLMCTAWCSWNHLNASRLGPAFAAELAWRRRESLRMVRSFERVALRAISRGGRAHFEWPAFCAGWAQVVVKRMVSRLKLAKARFDGCAFGVHASDSLLALKPWCVATSCPALASALSAHRCSRLHRHGQLHGIQALHSGHYPDAMCRCILASLRDAAACLRP